MAMAQKSPSSKPKKKFFKSATFGDKLQEVLMLMPMFIGFMLFVIYPILWVLRWAWFQHDGFTTPTFIGFDNFVRAFTRDPSFWMSLQNTFFLAFAKLIIEMPLALGLAVLVNNKVRGSSFFRVVYFMPTIFSVAVVGLIFLVMFSAFNGIINNLLVHFGFITRNINWFGDRWLALTVVLLVSVWTTFGLNMIYFLMGLQNVPKELYECASIDGASAPRQFFSITLPLLGPVMQIIFMISMLGTMRSADLVLVMTNGQPGGSTEVVMTYIFKLFFQFGDMGSRTQFGYGSALVLITAFFLGIITVIYLRISRRLKNIY